MAAQLPWHRGRTRRQPISFWVGRLQLTDQVGGTVGGGLWAIV
jgi:hypothetical protein